MKHYHVLLAMLTTKGGQSVRAIASLMSADYQETYHTLVTMSELHDPLVYCSGQRWYIAGVDRDGEVKTGAYKYLDEVKGKPGVDPVHTWKDEVLTGMKKDGKRSEIDRAVLPTGCCGCGCSDPDKAAKKANRIFIDPRGRR
jgi:hypothetical protein